MNIIKWLQEHSDRRIGKIKYDDHIPRLKWNQSVIVTDEKFGKDSQRTYGAVNHLTRLGGLMPGASAPSLGVGGLNPNRIIPNI